MSLPSTANPTSEVGSPPATADMQQMLNNLIDVIRTFQTSSSSSRPVVLPKFDPNSKESDAESWCTTADFIFDEKPLIGSGLISVLSSALMGEAAQWLTQICFNGITWTQFRELFMQRFGKQDTTAAVILNWMNGRPKDRESLAAYGSRLVNALKNKLKNKNSEEIAVSVALAFMSRHDKKLQRLALTMEVKNRLELQHELKAYAYTETDLTIAPPPAKI